MKRWIYGMISIVLLCLGLETGLNKGAHGSVEVFAVLRGLLGNGISDLASDGLHIWAGTGNGLSRSIPGGSSSADWQTFTVEDGLGSNGVTALAVSGRMVWVATAHDSAAKQSEVSDGISVSHDGGESWTTFRPPRGFGLGNTIWDLALGDGVVWAAGWNAFGYFDSGLLRSQDGGASWQSIVANPLPNGRHTFSVLVDGNTVWVGSAAGISRSLDGGTNWVVQAAPEYGLTGNWVFTLRKQDTPAGRVIWACTWPTAADEQFGLSRTRDDGATWESIPAFQGIQAVDLVFQGETIWVGTLSGLWKSEDDGASWYQFTQQDSLADDEVLSLLVFNETLWVGTADGLNFTRDGGVTWNTVHASPATVPLGTPKAQTAMTYAYPNPFSPLRHNLVRIRYSLSQDMPVTIRIYDFANALVATLLDHQLKPGGEELDELWDGRNQRGDVVANGVYFYRIEAGERTQAFGKIVVLD